MRAGLYLNNEVFLEIQRRNRFKAIHSPHFRSTTNQLIAGNGIVSLLIQGKDLQLCVWPEVVPNLVDHVLLVPWNIAMCMKRIFPIERSLMAIHSGAVTFVGGKIEAKSIPISSQEARIENNRGNSFWG